MSQVPADVAAFIQGGVSITVASRDDRLVPSITKAVGCKVNAGCSEVTIFLFAHVGEAVARDVARHGQVAVVFSQPSTNATVQVKSRSARPVPLEATDVALVRRYLALFADDLRPLGWDHHYVDAVFWHDPSHLIAIRLQPDGIFQQTPGPGAGEVLGTGLTAGP